MKDKKRERVNLSLTIKEYNKLKELAEEDGIKPGTYAKLVLADYLKKKRK